MKLKNIILLGVISSISPNAICQQNEYLDINNLKTKVNYKGNIVHDQNGIGIEAGINSGASLLYESEFGIINLDHNNYLKWAKSGEAYRIFQSGPIMAPMHYANEVTNWEKVWKVNKSDIDFHINNFSDPNYIIPASILDWPGNGDTSLYQDFLLAPFVDLNNNNIYEPQLGDYPEIKGDQAIWMIMNDEIWNTSTLNQWFMKIQVEVMAYAYKCNGDSAIDNSIFFNYKIENKSNIDLDSTYFGIMNDFDIGDPYNDFSGCDVSRSTYYCYNGYPGDYILGSDIGAIGLTIVSGPLKLDDGIDNPGPISNTSNINCQNAKMQNGICYYNQAKGYSDGIIDNERSGLESFCSYNSNNSMPFDYPNIASRYFYFCNNRWADGSNFYYGGSGYQTGVDVDQNNKCKYLFPGNSDSLGYGANPNSQDWNEISAGHLPNHRKQFGSTGMFSIKAGNVEKIETAYVFARKYNTTLTDYEEIITEPVNIMLKRVDQLKEFDRTGRQCGNYFSINENINKIKFNIYPNPFTNSFRIELNEVNNDTEITIVNMLGKEVKQIITNQIETEIDLSKYCSGIYFVKVKQGDVISTKKIIKH